MATTSNEELACVYAALLLLDDDVPITGEKIATVLKAAGVEVEPFWPGLFAKALESCDVKSLVTNISSGIGAVGGGGGGAAGVGGGSAEGADEKTEEKKEEKKQEEEEESDEDLGFGLFD